MKILRLNSNDWRITFLLIFVIAASVRIITILRESNTLEDLNLETIINVPRKFRTQNSDWHCQFGLDDIINATEPDDLPKLGILPKESQLKHETISDGCYRSSIAIYSNTHSANTAYNILQEANRTIATSEITPLVDLGEDAVMVTALWEFQTIPSTVSFEKMKIQSRLLIMHQCNAVITLLVFIRKNDETFGLQIDDNDIVSYAEQIDERIEKQICPIMSAYK